MLLYKLKKKPTVFLHLSLWKTGLISNHKTENQAGYREADSRSPFSIREQGEACFLFFSLQTQSNFKFIVSPVVTFRSLQGPIRLFPPNLGGAWCNMRCGEIDREASLFPGCPAALRVLVTPGDLPAETGSCPE